ncbi:hypothetical protein BC826DRAFT_1107010 [Russula brevipes]|nr:hypothetical protein BC826DRAFT_1107010 [Russula brevipes]
MLEKKLSNFSTPRLMQWGSLVLVLGCNVCAVLEKELGDFSTLRLMQRSPLVLVLGCSICTVLKELGSLYSLCLIRGTIAETYILTDSVKKVSETYRDHAEERRLGKEGDYAQVEATLEEFEKRNADNQDREAGLDFALFEQNRVRLASASSKQDDEALEEVFAHTASTSSVPTSKKRSRADIINELKEKRANGGESEQSNEKAVIEKQPDSSMFRPIGFKPIGGLTGDKARKKKGKEGNEPKKKKRKVEPPSLDAGEQAGPKDATPLPAPVDHAVSMTAPHEPIQPTPVEEDFDIFADAGEYKGVESGSDDDDDEGGPSVAPAEDAHAQRRGWFDDAAEPKPEAAAAPPPRTPAKPPTSVPEARVETEEEQSARLAPLSSSAMPSIRDFLAMDEVVESVEKEEKRKARKEKRMGKDKGS